MATRAEAASEAYIAIINNSPALATYGEKLRFAKDVAVIVNCMCEKELEMLRRDAKAVKSSKEES